MLGKKSIINIIHSVLNSYSQVFFSENKIFASILLIVSFIDIWAGVSGIIAVVTANGVAYIMGYNRINTKRGLYGFNALLVALGTGLMFQPGLELLIIVFFASLLTFFITISIEGILTKYGLPFLSIPFLFGIWAVILSTKNFDALGLSQRGIYTYNELYALGGNTLINFYEKIDTLNIHNSIKIYFLSLGAIFFQTNILAGVLIAVGLLYYSRIAFSLSVLGFYVAYLFYSALGADFSQLAYTFIGFNYILSSIAVGGYFVVPSWRSYLWTILLLPVTVLITAALQNVFLIWGISIFSLPFNLLVLVFIYSLKLRYFKRESLSDIFVRQNTPEKTLYLNKTYSDILKDKNYIPISLPFWGNWKIMQAHNGQYTHKDEWRHAWDFIIIGNNDKEFLGSGEKVEDYFCYEKNIIAPANGYIVDIADGIPNNKIGETNSKDNWGNSVVIKHTEYLYSQISHIKSGTFKVHVGDYINKGEIIAKVGNSGYSPYPHMHFQLQATPFIGSKTLKYPLANFVVSENGIFDYKIFDIPLLNQNIATAQNNELMVDTVKFIPGKEINVQIIENKKTKNEKWIVEKNIFNQTFVKTSKDNAIAYFFADETGIYFTNFTGNTKSVLFDFFSAFYNVKNAFYKNIEIKSFIRPNLFFNKILILIQDFFAPFYLFLKTKYNIKYIETDDSFNPEYILLESHISKYFFNKNIHCTKYSIEIKKEKKITITKNESKQIILN